MGVGFDELIAAVSRDKLDDCAHVIRAAFENNACQYIWAMPQYKDTDQLINERLGGGNT